VFGPLGTTPEVCAHLLTLAGGVGAPLSKDRPSRSRRRNRRGHGLLLAATAHHGD